MAEDLRESVRLLEGEIARLRTSLRLTGEECQRLRAELDARTRAETLGPRSGEDLG